MRRGELLVMKIESGENEYIFCQAIANLSLLSQLSINNFLGSDYYNTMSWSMPEQNQHNIKTILDRTGMGNPAMMQMFLYVLLVMPKELLGGDYCKDDFNREVQKYMSSFRYNSTYPGEDTIENANYYRHIRNAIAHSKCEYTIDNGKSYVIFRDGNPNNRNEFCKIMIQREDVGKVLDFLMRKLMEVVNEKSK